MEKSTLILTCSKCTKPFNNRSSHHRHSRYCGSRTRHRQRSCHACAAAKAKCSFGVPCSRCSRKDVECLYADSVYTRTQALRIETSDLQSCEPPSQAVADERNGFVLDFNLDSRHFICEENEQQDLVELQSSRQFAFDNHDDDDSAYRQHLSKVDMSTTVNETQDHHKPAWCTWAQQGLSLSAVSGNQTIAITSTQIRRSEQSAAHQNAELIVQALRAFPTMMLRKETWPWFIHPHSHLLLESTVTTLPNALSACMGIAQMYMLGTAETRPFVWQTVSIEYHRLAKTMQVMSKLELLAAIQACMIYLIMCIIEEGSLPNDALGSELLQVLGDLYTFYKITYAGDTCHAEITNPSSDWAGWIFAESQRRLAILWLLIGCVVRVRTAGSIRDRSQSYRRLPLPAPKLLWAASSESAWTVEYEASRILLQANGLVYVGDLIDAQTSSGSQQQQQQQLGARKLDLWNANVDNLGLLLGLVHNMA